MIGLAVNNWRVTVLTRWADPQLPEIEAVSPQLRIVRLRIGDVARLDKRLLNDLHLESLAAAEHALSDIGKPRLIHSVYWNSGRVAMELSGRHNIPFVHTVISNGWRRQKYGLADQPAARLATEAKVFGSAFAIFCVSEEERRDLLEYYAVSPMKIRVVGRPVADVFQHPCHDELGRPDALRWPGYHL